MLRGGEPADCQDRKKRQRRMGADFGGWQHRDPDRTGRRPQQDENLRREFYRTRRWRSHSACERRDRRHSIFEPFKGFYDNNTGKAKVTIKRLVAPPP
jgi:hypothetical protein